MSYEKVYSTKNKKEDGFLFWLNDSHSYIIDTKYKVKSKVFLTKLFYELQKIGEIKADAQLTDEALKFISYHTQKVKFWLEQWNDKTTEERQDYWCFEGKNFNTFILRNFRDRVFITI